MARKLAERDQQAPLSTRELAVLRLIVLVMVVLGVANAVNMGVFERMGEFGTMRALGNRGRFVVGLILSECLLLGLAGAEKAIERLRPGVVRRRILHYFPNEDSLLEARDLRHGGGRFVYQLVIVDRARDATRLLLRAVWPEAEWIKLRYGRVGPGVRLHHVWAALRGQP